MQPSFLANKVQEMLSLGPKKVLNNSTAYTPEFLSGTPEPK